MGNDLVGQIIEAFKKDSPELTVIKIWNKKKLNVVIAVHNPENWREEMDPYYAYVDGLIDGLTVMDNLPVLEKVMVDSNLIYVRKSEDKE